MASFDNPSSDRQLAYVGSDEEIYQRLPPTKRVYFSSRPNYPETLCKEITATECLETEGSSWPDPRTFARQDVEEFLGSNLFNHQGAWSISWRSGSRYTSDIIHEDGFRSILGFKAIHIMIRPLGGSIDNGSGPARLFITPTDARNILKAALEKNPSNPMGAVLGQAFALDPKEVKAQMIRYYPGWKLEPKFALEWKVGLPPASYLNVQVQRWKKEAFGGDDKNQGTRDVHQEQPTSFGGMAPGPSSSQGSIPGPSQASQGGPETSPYQQQRKGQRGKRPSWELGISQEMGPGSKRRSYGSLYSSASQLGWASQSSGSSRDMSREGPAAEWDERAGSAMGNISTTMESLAVTSPQSSPAGIPPPTAGAPWGMPPGMPQDMSRTAFGQSGGGFEHQGRGGVEMVNEFGHWVERPIPRPSPMGFPPGPPMMAPAGHYGPSQQWQQEVPPRQYAAQQHPGTGYSAYSGPSTRTHDPDDPSGQNFPPMFQPQQQGSYGMETNVSQPFRHMSGGSQQARDYPPRFRHMPMTQSPEILDQAAGSAPFSSAPGPQHDLQPLPPPATHGIERAQFIPPTTLAQGGEDYPSSLAPTAQATTAGVPFQPGPGYESGDSESGREDAPESDGGDASESGGEDSVSDGEAPMEHPAFHQHEAPQDVDFHAQGGREDPESGGEDAPGSYEEHSVSGGQAAPEAQDLHAEDPSEESESDGQDDQRSPSQYLSFQGGPRFYHSPSPNPAGQHWHVFNDPWAGHPGSEERDSDDPDSADEFKHRRTRGSEQ